MRLKIIFFPIVLILVMYVSIAFTWPEYEAGVAVQTVIDQKQKVLDDVKAKKAQIGTLKSSLDQNPEKEAAIMAYLPDSKQEEKIINAIDHIATSAGVSLVNLSVVSSKPVAVAAAPVEFDPSLLGSVGEIDGAMAENVVPVEVRPDFIFTESKINVAGEYEYIKNFIDQLNSIGVYNTISEVSIAKQQAAGQGTENQKGQTNSLSAEISVKFSYLPRIENSQSLGNNIDFSVSDTIAKLVAGTPAAPNVENLGKINPFLP